MLRIRDLFFAAATLAATAFGANAVTINSYINAPNPWVAGTQQTVSFGYAVPTPPTHDYTQGWVKLTLDGSTIYQQNTAPVALDKQIDVFLDTVGDHVFELSGSIRFVDIYQYVRTYTYSYSCGWFRRCTGYGSYTVTDSRTTGTGSIIAQQPITVVAPVPLPAGFPLLAAAVGGLALLRRRKAARA